MSREKTELSDESLWKLFGLSANEASSHSVLERTQAAADAITSPRTIHTDNDRDNMKEGPQHVPANLESININSGRDNVTPEVPASLDIIAPVTQDDSSQGIVEKEDEEEGLVYEIHQLDTVIEETSREGLNSSSESKSHSGQGDMKMVNEQDKNNSTSSDKSSNSTTSKASSNGRIRIKAKAVREIKSPFETAISDNLREGTTPKALSRDNVITIPAIPITPASYPQPTTQTVTEPTQDGADSAQYTGAMPGGFFVTVEKHLPDNGDEERLHVTSTPHVTKIAGSAQAVTRAPQADPGNRDGSSSSCQSSFDIPQPQFSDDSGSAVAIAAANKAEKPAEPAVNVIKQGRSRSMLSNPQLMGQDVQVRQYDNSNKLKALQSITAKQGQGKQVKTKYRVPVTRVSSAHELRSAAGDGTRDAHASTSAPSLSNQNITVHHELVATDFVKGLLERLMGREAAAQTSADTNPELREIRSLETKLQSTEQELEIIKRQMSSQQRDDQSKVLAELVHSQRNLQHQLLSLKTADSLQSRGAGVTDPDMAPLKTPAPRHKYSVPAAAQPEESPALPGGFMEQVVRNYPSPVSPQKPSNQAPPPASPLRAPICRRRGDYTPPSRLSPEPRLHSPSRQDKRGAIVTSPTGRRSPSAKTSRLRDNREVTNKQEEKTQKELNQLKRKVDNLLDERRMENMEVEAALRRDAPIDRYLADIEQVSQSNKTVMPKPKAQSKANKEDRRIKYNELDATFLLPENETMSLTAQMKNKLNKLKKQAQLREDNLNTVLALRSRDQHNLYNTDGGLTDEDSRLRKLIKANLDRAEADVQKQVSQIDFIPNSTSLTARPLQDINVATRPAHRYRTAAERLKAVQSKIDTGIAKKKAAIPVDKENREEPIDLYRDDNYIKRVYGKALYHAQRRTVEKARPDSPTRPVPYKKTSGKIVKSEKSQAPAPGKKAPVRPEKTKTGHVKPINKPSSPSKKSASPQRGGKPKSTVATGVSSDSARIHPTTILGSGMRIAHEDPTKLVLDVLPLSKSEPTQSTLHTTVHTKSSGGEPPKSGATEDGVKLPVDKPANQKRRSPISITKVSPPINREEMEKKNKSPAAVGAADADSGNQNNNANDNQSDRQDVSDSQTSEWQESVDTSPNPPFLMTADSLDLSAVTPAAEANQRSSEGVVGGQAHSTPVEDSNDNAKTSRTKQKSDKPVSSAPQTKAADKQREGQQHQGPPPRAWEEFENEYEAGGSLADSDKSRTDDIITPPTVLPGYQYRQVQQPRAQLVTDTPITRPRHDLYSTGAHPVRDRGGASHYPPEQGYVDPALVKPLYDPTEMATRDWLEQRLMARCVERMIREYPVRKPLNPEDPTSGDKDDSDPGSVDNDLVAGAMAEGGAAQVYITAGKPVNTEQVRNLVRECLAEKIRTMLETRETLDRTPEDVMAAAASKPIREGDQTSQPMRAQENQQEPDVRHRETVERVVTPEPTPPSSPEEAVDRRPLLAQTPEPSPPMSPVEPVDAVSLKKPQLVRRKSSETRLGVDTDMRRSSTGRMPSTPFEMSLRKSRTEEDEVKIHEEGVPPSPAPPSAPATPALLQEGQTQTEDKLHLSQVSLWDTLSATGKTQDDTMMDDEPVFEMRYSIDTPEPTPPSSPPLAVSVQTSLNEQILQDKLRASGERTPVNDEVSSSRPASRQQTPTPVSRPDTPLKVETPTPATPQPPPATSDEIIQPHVVQVAPAVQSEDPDSPIITTTVSETNMNTVSEGEWILKSDGQLTPDRDGTMADFSLASDDSDDQSAPGGARGAAGRQGVGRVISVAPAGGQGHALNRLQHDEDHSEGEIVGPRTDPMVALLSRLKETPKALKSKAPTEDGEHIIVSGERKQSSRSAIGEPDGTMRLSDLEKTTHAASSQPKPAVRRQLSLENNTNNNQSSSSNSAGFVFADSKQVTVKRAELQEALSQGTNQPQPAHQVIQSQPMRTETPPQVTNPMSPNKSTKGAPTRRAIPGMIQSTLDSSRKSRPTSSLRTTQDFSQMSTSMDYTRTRESADSPDRIRTETLLKSGGYLSTLDDDTTQSDVRQSRRPESHTLNTQQLLARTIDSQGLSTGESTAMLDTNKLLADTLDQQTTYTPSAAEAMLPQRTRTLRSEVINEGREMGVTDSIDSVSSTGILRSSNEYTRTLSGAPRPKQYLRFSVPTGDEDSSSEASDDVSEFDF